MASQAEFLTMKVRAEKAEARVRALEAEIEKLKAARKPAAEEPKEELVQVAPGHWAYKAVKP